MSVLPIEPGGFAPFVPQMLGADPAASSRATDPVRAAVDASSITGTAGSGTDFAQLLANGIENLQAVHDRTDQLAVAAATGDLDALHDYTITATEAAVSTQLTTAVRNKALEAFQEIMRMSI